MLSAQTLLQELENNIARAIVGKAEAVELLLNALGRDRLQRAGLQDRGHDF